MSRMKKQVMQNWFHSIQSHICKYIIFLTPILVEFIEDHKQKYHFECATEAKMFLQWAPGELWKIKYGLMKQSNSKDETVPSEKQIPAAYHWIACQLTAEIIHAKDHTGHKALHRCSYVIISNRGFFFFVALITLIPRKVGNKRKVLTYRSYVITL